MRSFRRAALALAASLAAAGAAAQEPKKYADPDSPATEAAARAALPNAEIRPISAEVRRIGGVQKIVSGQVMTLAAIQRGLEGSGLETRAINGGLEVLLPGDVLFDFDKATIRTSAIPILEKVAVAARQTGTRPIRVEGHTDAVGQPAYNQRLSEARANAVFQWLVRGGIPQARLTAQGLGATRPVAPNKTPAGQDDPAGRQKNRRVTVIFQG